MIKGLKKLIFLALLAVSGLAWGGDGVGYSTYTYDSNIYSLNTDKEYRTPYHLEMIISAYLRKAIEEQEIIPIKTFSCSYKDSVCTKKGIELIGKYPDLYEYIITKKQHDLNSFIVLHYSIHFMKWVFCLLLFSITLKLVLYRKGIVFWSSFIIIPSSYIIFECILFYYKSHPLFFLIGFNVFFYIPATFFYIIFASMLDIHVSKYFYRKIVSK